ncbi:MAG TPA: phospho-N-acetylmuramoyl-pentapeptide-transferase [Candidatus Xenobia bacterium]|jgi:phospho-N-acetylmuramoyl-pentapeptide-transferase
MLSLFALVTSWLTVAAIMPWFIDTVKRLAWGQQIREDGPKDHQKKAGTPTMGGLVIVVATVVGMAWAWKLGHPLDTLTVLACVAGNCAIGFFDDYAKIRKQRNLGLTSRQKLAAQLVVGAVLGAFLVFYHPSGSTVIMPFCGPVHSGMLAFAMAVLVMLSTTNAVNLTDGLDGLAGGTMVSAALAYLAIAWLAGRPDLAVCAGALAGGCLGFLQFNRYPARIFMGDTGSLALGGALTALAVLTRTEWLLLLIGGVFVAEAVSVILQVGYFKLTHGKRIFRMSPLHHHFCEGGWPETRVTSTFWTIAAGLGALGVLLWYGLRSVWPPL